MAIKTEKLSNSSRSGKLKKYIGNNLKLTLSGTTTNNYLIIGNNCNITMHEFNDETTVKVIGDNCRLTVKRCHDDDAAGGRVIYVGSNGKISFLGADNSPVLASDAVVTYIGSGGEICGIAVNKSGGATTSEKDVKSAAKCFDNDVVNVSNSNAVHIQGAINNLTATISLPNIKLNVLSGSNNCIRFN